MSVSFGVLTSLSFVNSSIVFLVVTQYDVTSQDDESDLRADCACAAASNCFRRVIRRTQLVPVVSLSTPVGRSADGTRSQRIIRDCGRLRENRRRSSIIVQRITGHTFLLSPSLPLCLSLSYIVVSLPHYIASNFTFLYFLSRFLPFFAKFT